MPVTDRCPQCGGYMVEKRGRKGELWHLCANENCRCKVEVAAADENDGENADE